MGFNMSWVFVDRIELNDLYTALDIVKGEAVDEEDLGTSDVPLAGLVTEAGWSAVFAKYSLVLDLTIGTDPPRLARLPAECRAVSCVVLEHANITYASLWQGGRQIWEIRHQPLDGRLEHLEFWGDLPVNFMGVWNIALQKQREDDARRKTGEWGVDHIFDVPLEIAAEITGFRHDRNVSDEFRNVTRLAPRDGVVLDRLSNPPKWWQTVNSIEYR